MKTDFAIGIREDISNPKPRLLLARIDVDSKDKEIHHDATDSVRNLFHLIEVDDDTTIVTVAQTIDELINLETMDLPNEFDVHSWSKVKLTSWRKTKDAIVIYGEVTIDPVQRLRDTADKLPEIVVFTKGDGAHCGLFDWYPAKEKALEVSLSQGLPFTTGWYSSKKEIASARISSDGRNVLVEASVSDDFDCCGLDWVMDKRTADLEVISKLVEKAHAGALQNQKENNTVDMYAVGHVDADGSRKDWIETYLVDTSEFGGDEVPGDNYHTWGWQGDTDLPEEVKEAFENQMDNMPYTFDEFIMEKLGDV